MKIKINENQYRRLLETVTDDNEKDYIGKKIMLYYNLHKKTFSIIYKGLVVIHADYVKLTDVEFRVRQGGREKARCGKRPRSWRAGAGTSRKASAP
jgi:hypothetical protein